MRRSSQPAPGGRNQGFPAGSVFDPARYQNANGESCGGDFNSQRSGLFDRDRTGMQKEASKVRCTVLDGSAWSTERTYMRRQWYF